MTHSEFSRAKALIILGIGSNLPSPIYGPPAAVCRAAIARLEAAGLHPVGVSRFYETAPMPASDQPWYVNAAVAVSTALEPRAALAACLVIEAEMGRVRGERNAARIVDLDLLAWNERIIDEPGLIVPHPRLTERAFALLPMADLAPDWRHPVSGESISNLIAKLPPNQQIRLLSTRQGLEFDPPDPI
jgi:2-amino-4-hydroxy-6-hydroxymethyldihydropteridine diphosphokinase